MGNSMAELFEIMQRVVKEADQNALENPTSDKIQVVIVEPLKKPYKKIIANALDDKEKIVGGYTEKIIIGKTATGARIGIVVNEEGKLQGLPLNRRLIGLDDLVGTFFITAYNMIGDNISLNDEEAEKMIKLFSTMEVYL
jgi:hypothetical protein